MNEEAKEKLTTDDGNPAPQPYHPPAVESHNPLEIMSAWEDKSSELEF